MRILPTFIAVALLATPGAAVAKPLATEQFKSSAQIALDPSRAYLLVRSPGMDLKLVRVPTAADRQAYAQERAAALLKAKAKFEKQLKSYRAQLEDYRDQVRRGVPRMERPREPVEPTDANLKFPDIETDNFVTVWAGRVFDRDAGPAHLIAVPPGTYRIYGTILEGPNGAVGTCMCMGSVQFDAAAGMITDMGTMHYPIAEAGRDKVEPSWNGLTPGKGGLTSMRVEPAIAADAVPAKLASFRRAPALYRAAGKMDNFFGVMIDRLTPLPGVLAYRRDSVIDEQNGAEVGAY